MLHISGVVTELGLLVVDSHCPNYNARCKAAQALNNMLPCMLSWDKEVRFADSFRHA